MTDKPRILDGIKVLDLTNVLSGPFASLHLALLGAEVIKIENPKDGDLARKLGIVPEYNKRLMGTSFLAQNCNKKSVTLNTKSPEGKEIFKRLVRDADVRDRELPARRHGAARARLRRPARDQSPARLLRDLRLRPDRPGRRQAGLRPDHPGALRRDGDQRRRTADAAARRLSRLRHRGRAERGVRGHGRPLPPRADRRRASASMSRSSTRSCR